MLDFIKRFITEERAQGVTEYALALGVIIIATIALISTFSGSIQTAWTNRTNGLGTSVANATVHAP